MDARLNARDDDEQRDKRMLSGVGVECRQRSARERALLVSKAVAVGEVRESMSSGVVRVRERGSDQSCGSVRKINSQRHERA